MSRLKYRISFQMVYWVWMYTKILSHADMNNRQGCNGLVLLQWLLVVEHSHCLCLWLCSSHYYQLLSLFGVGKAHDSIQSWSWMLFDLQFCWRIFVLECYLLASQAFWWYTHVGPNILNFLFQHYFLIIFHM